MAPKTHLSPRSQVWNAKMSFQKHSFFMFVRSWMMCNFVLMRNFMYWQRWNSNDCRLLSMWFIQLALIIDEIKYLIEIEPNTKISEFIHEMCVFVSMSIWQQGLKKSFAVLCVQIFMTYHWYQDDWNWVKSHVSEKPSSSSTKWNFWAPDFRNGNRLNEKNIWIALLYNTTIPILTRLIKCLSKMTEIQFGLNIP